MEITIDYLTEKFNEYNAKYFNSELPLPQFKLGRARRTYGQHKRTRFFGKFVSQITISTFWERTEKNYCTTLLHEMIHYYIRFKGLKDNKMHGRLFYQIADRINKDGWDIRRCGENTTTPSDANKQTLHLAVFKKSNTYHLIRMNPKYKYRLLTRLSTITYKDENGKVQVVKPISFTSTDSKYLIFNECRSRLVGYIITKEVYEMLVEKTKMQDVA